jgi:hypothetical protein
MENHINLYNAAVVGENPQAAYLVEGGRLHAVEKSVAELKKDQCDPEKTLPLIREGLKALITFAKGKAEPHFLEVDWKAMTGKNEQAQLIDKIKHIYGHLPHHDRNTLSTLIHHKTAR